MKVRVFFSKTQWFVVLLSDFIQYVLLGDMITKGLALEVFEKMDTNEDGKVIEEEFVRACCNDETISKLLIDDIKAFINKD